MNNFTKRDAVEQMIDAAIVAYDSSKYAVTVTLAGAAEGAMPEPEGDHLFRLSQIAARGYLEPKAINRTLNEARDWLKHFNTAQPSLLNINQGVALSQIVRAMSKFQNLYGFQAETPTMREFFKLAREFGPYD